MDSVFDDVALAEPAQQPAPATPLRTFALMLEAAQATGSKLDKQEIVRAAVEGPHGPDIRKLLTYALSPYIRFYVQQYPEPASGGFTGKSIGLDMVCATLDAISQRRLTGQTALNAISTLSALLDWSDTHGMVSDREAVRRVILKDLKAGFEVSTVNKVIPGLIPSFAYMRCSLPKDAKLDKWPWAEGIFSQEKADGMFANFNRPTAGSSVLFSRQGSMFPMESFEDLAAEADAIFPAGTQTHGELLVERDGVVLAREIGNGILNSVLKGGHGFAPNERPIYLVWDQVPLDIASSKGKHTVPYRDRFMTLVGQVHISDIIRTIDSRIVKSIEEAYAHYAELLGQGKEGTIIKNPGMAWKDGSSKEQVKLKLEVDVDLAIVGFVAGQGKNAATFGSLLCRTSCGGLEVAVSGMSDAMRAKIHAERDQVLGKILCVRANQVMKPSQANGLHSLFLPRFVEIREDKTQADSLQRVLDQFASAIRV